MNKKHVARTCVGCRRIDDQINLVRIVRNSDGHGILIDHRARFPGRGAYSHPTQDCLHRAQRRVRSSLRLVDPVDLAGVGKVLMSVLDKESS